jgi:hypothetical protein
MNEAINSPRNIGARVLEHTGVIRADQLVEQKPAL